MVVNILDVVAPKIEIQRFELLGPTETELVGYLSANIFSCLPRLPSLRLNLLLCDTDELFVRRLVYVICIAYISREAVRIIYCYIVIRISKRWKTSSLDHVLRPAQSLRTPVLRFRVSMLLNP